MSADWGSTGGRERGFPFLAVAAVSAIMGAIVTRWVTALPYGNPDSHAFEAIARSLIAGRGFVYWEPMLGGLPFVAYRSPGYPAFLAPLLAIGGVPLALTVQGALAGFTAALIGRLGDRLGGRLAAWTAWVLAMAWWPTWVLAGQLLSETLYVTLSVLVVTALVAAERAAGRREIRLAALAGALTAVAALTRSPGAAVGAALALGLLFLRPRLVAPYLLAAVVVWAPWPIRNAFKLDAFVPLTTNAAMNFFDGNSPVETAACWEAMAAHPERGELGFEQYFAERTRRELLTDPGALARGMVAKAALYLVPSENYRFVWVRRLALVIAAVGLAWFASVRRAWLLPGLAYLAQWAASAATVVRDRHRYPGDWPIVLAAALTLAAWGALRYHSRSSPYSVSSNDGGRTARRRP